MLHTMNMVGQKSHKEFYGSCKQNILLTSIMNCYVAGHFNIDGSQVSVSGFSSGGAMAMQVHVAHSSLFKGAASFGGR